MNDLPEASDSPDLIGILGVTGYTIASSVEINGLWIRPNEVQTHIARYALRLVCYTADPVYQFQHLGTATGVRFGDRLFAISTNHQRLLGRDGGMGIFCDDLESVVTPHKMYSVSSASGEQLDDEFDFCLFEFDPLNYAESTLLPSQFINVLKDVGVDGMRGAAAFNLGYPTRLQTVDYFERRVDLKLACNGVEILEETQTRGIFKFRTLDEERFFEDGMSGSPVFELRQVLGKFCIHWLGMVIRGGRNSRTGRVLSASSIVDHIRNHVVTSPGVKF